MNLLNIQRFSFLLKDELLNRLSSLIRTTFAGFILGLVVYGVFIYTNILDAPLDLSMFSPVLFDFALVVGGVIFTSIIFRDLHTNCENIHYLMLPASTLEKMLVRYLVSGPLLVIYLMLAYTIFELIAQTVLSMLLSTTFSIVDWSEDWVWTSITSYLGVHACIFLGAVIFKKNNLVRTMLYTFGVFVCVTFIYKLVTLIKYSEFTEHWYGGFADSNILVFVKLELSPWFETTLQFAICVWLLFLAYLWVKDYEV